MHLLSKKKKKMRLLSFHRLGQWGVNAGGSGRVYRLAKVYVQRNGAQRL